MKNFFDVATPQEAQAHFALDDEPLSPDELAEERRYLEADSDGNLSHLAGLFADRGDFEQAETCMNAITDGLRRADTGRMLGHDPHYLEWAHNRA